jgi:hypothetical protein
MPALAQADAKRDFLSVCRKAIQDSKRIYVEDRSGKRYLTLDPQKRHLTAPVLTLTAQFFKDNFSRCSSLIKDGLCFNLTIRGITEPIFARRHTKYIDPCDVIIENWQNKVAELAQPQEAELLEVLRHRFEHRSGSGYEELLAAIDKLKRGIVRVAIGHHPFYEGPLSDDG